MHETVNLEQTGHFCGHFFLQESEIDAAELSEALMLIKVKMRNYQK